jgi:hypothetical protein
MYLPLFPENNGKNKAWKNIKIVNNEVRLNKDYKYQFVDFAKSEVAKIELPKVRNSEVAEIHLIFKGSETLVLTLPSCKWQPIPTFEDNKYYELIFTYYKGVWLAGCVVYGD